MVNHGMVGLHFWTIRLSYFASTDDLCTSEKENIKVISKSTKFGEKCRRLVERKIKYSRRTVEGLSWPFGQKFV